VPTGDKLEQGGESLNTTCSTLPICKETPGLSNSTDQKQIYAKYKMTAKEYNKIIPSTTNWHNTYLLVGIIFYLS
jgi:hypothetical protein